MSTNIGRALVNEATERMMRETVNSALTSARSSGQDSRTGVLSALGRLTGNPDFEREMKRIVGTIPGATYGPHIVFSGIAHYLANRDFAQHILPGDNSAFALGARSFMRLLPSATIGVGDSFADVLRSWVDGVQSDPTLPEDQRNGQHDRMVSTPLLPREVFAAAIDDAGEIRRYPDGTPRVNNRDWIRVYDMWRSVNTSRRETRGRGRNAQQVVVPGQPFPYDMVPVDQAIEILEAMNVRGANLDPIRRLFQKPDFGRDVSDETVLVMLAISNVSSRSSSIFQFLSEDLAEDVPKRGNVTLLNRMIGAQFGPLVTRDANGVPTLPTDVCKTVLQALDDWMGAEHQVQNKILRAASNAYDAARNRGWNPVGAGILALAFTAPIWATAIMVVGGFLAGVVMFIDGFMTPVTGTTTLGGYTVESVKYAVVAMYIGYMLVFATTWPLPIWEKLINAIPWLGNNRPEWLTSIGRKIGSMATILGGMCAFAAWLEIDVWYRILIPISMFTAVGLALALTEGDRRELVKAKLASGVRYLEWAFVVVPLAIAFICGPIAAHTGTFVTGLMLIEMVLVSIAKVLVASKWLSTVLLFALGAIGAIVAYIKTTRFTIHRGERVRLSNAKVPFLGACFVGLMAAGIAFIFLAEPAEKAQLSKLFDPNVSVTDITTVDASTGGKMREKEVVRESGATSTLKRGTVVTGSSTPTPKRKRVDCSKPMPVDVRTRLCP